MYRVSHEVIIRYQGYIFLLTYRKCNYRQEVHQLTYLLQFTEIYYRRDQKSLQVGKACDARFYSGAKKLDQLILTKKYKRPSCIEYYWWSGELVSQRVSQSEKWWLIEIIHILKFKLSKVIYDPTTDVVSPRKPTLLHDVSQNFQEVKEEFLN